MGFFSISIENKLIHVKTFTQKKSHYKGENPKKEKLNCQSRMKPCVPSMKPVMEGNSVHLFFPFGQLFIITAGSIRRTRKPTKSPRSQPSISPTIFYSRPATI